jgi:hypothetical protein
MLAWAGVSLRVGSSKTIGGELGPGKTLDVWIRSEEPLMHLCRRFFFFGGEELRRKKTFLKTDIVYF